MVHNKVHSEIISYHKIFKVFPEPSESVPALLSFAFETLHYPWIPSFVLYFLFSNWIQNERFLGEFVIFQTKLYESKIIHGTSQIHVTKVTKPVKVSGSITLKCYFGIIFWIKKSKFMQSHCE